MHVLNAKKAAVAVGSLAALGHALWVALVALNLSGPLLNFVFRIHFLSNPYVIQGFGWGRAIALVLVTFVAGYVVGYVFALIWNRLHRE